MNEKTRRVALLGVLFALAMALSFFEGALAPLLGLPPGVKPGLANVVVMYALFWLSWRDALALTVLKSGFVFLVQGASAAAAQRVRRRVRAGGDDACAPAGRHGVDAVGLGRHRAQFRAAGGGEPLVYAVGLHAGLRAGAACPPGLCMGSLTAAVLRAAAPAFDRLWKHKKNK